MSNIITRAFKGAFPELKALFSNKKEENKQDAQNSNDSSMLWTDLGAILGTTGGGAAGYLAAGGSLLGLTAKHLHLSGALSGLAVTGAVAGLGATVLGALGNLIGGAVAGDKGRAKGTLVGSVLGLGLGVAAGATYGYQIGAAAGLAGTLLSTVGGAKLGRFLGVLSGALIDGARKAKASNNGMAPVAA